MLPEQDWAPLLSMGVATPMLKAFCVIGKPTVDKGVPVQYFIREIIFNGYTKSTSCLLLQFPLPYLDSKINQACVPSKRLVRQR